MSAANEIPNAWKVMARLMACAASVFFFDLLTPLGVADGVLYAILILVVMRERHPRYIVNSAVTASALICLGAWFSPPPPDGILWIGLTNRVLSLFVVFSVTWLAFQRQRAYNALQTSRDNLWTEVGKRTGELSEANAKLEHEVQLRTRMEETLRRIVKGISSSTGPEFLREVVANLSESLNVDCAFVGELVGERIDEIHILSMWDRRNVAGGLTCPLEGTPCEIVGDLGVVAYPSGVREQFPDAHLLNMLGMESFACTAVIGSNQRKIGLLGIMDRKPLQDVLGPESLMPLVALRVASELERIRWEQELRQSEERYRELFEEANDIVYTHDLNGLFTSFNQAGERLTGYSRDEALGMTVYQAMLPEYNALVAERINAKTLQDERSTYPLEIMTKDGRRLSLEVSSRVIRDKSGNPVAVQGIARDITERLKAEERLLLLSAAVEATVEAIVVTDAAGVIQFVNPAFERLTGFTSSEAIGSTPRILTSGRQPPSYYEAMWSALMRQETWSDIFINRRKDNSLYYTEETITPAPSLAGGNALYVAVQRDITERMKMERALANERLMLDTLMDNLPDQVYVKDIEGRYLIANRAHLQALGVSDVKEVFGKSGFDVFPKEHAERLFADEQAVLRSGQPLLNQEEVALASDGTPQWLLTTKTPLRTKEGALNGVVGISRDITEWKQFQQERRRLAMAVEQATEGIAIANREGTVEYVNPALQRISGYAREEIMTLQMLLPGDDAAEKDSSKDARSQLDEGLTWSGLAAGRRKDGTPYDIAITAFPIFDVPGTLTGYVAIIRDVSQQKQIEAQLRRSQRLQSIGTLAGGIAHDFNNILTAIIGYTDLILMDLPQDGAYHSELEQISIAAARATKLVKQILASSRQVEGELTPIRVQPVVVEVLELLTTTFPKTIEIRENISPHCDMVRADATQLHQVVMNLCTNALHAMREHGGILEVSLAPVALDGERLLVLPGLRPGRYVRLTVSDSGHGMDKATLEHIFDPFFTTKEPSEGTGLGLATVHGIVTAFGGAVAVESEPGRGAVFTVYLPCLPFSGAEAEEDSLELAVVGGSERILVVDDEESLGRAAGAMLQRLGYQVTVMTSGVDALKAFFAQPDQFDLIVTDQTMPKLSGEQLARAVIRVRPRIPIILTTGYSETMTAEKARLMGLRGYLMKPYTLRRLGHLVRRALDEGALGAQPTD